MGVTGHSGDLVSGELAKAILFNKKQLAIMLFLAHFRYERDLKDERSKQLEINVSDHLTHEVFDKIIRWRIS